MQEGFINESMMEMFLFESNQQMELMEQILLKCEESGQLDGDSINELFRIMHTIKGSTAMMMQENLTVLAHAVEDLFAFLRSNPKVASHQLIIIQIVLECSDYIKEELSKLQQGQIADGDSSQLVRYVKDFFVQLNSQNPKDNNENAKVNVGVPRFNEKLKSDYTPIVSDADCLTGGYSIKHSYKALIEFESDCEMENIRAFGITHNLKGVAWDISHLPEAVINNPSACEFIRNNGFQLLFKSDMGYEDIKSILMQTVFLKSLELQEIEEVDIQPRGNAVEDSEIEVEEVPNIIKSGEKSESLYKPALTNNSMISVNVKKLDKLMDLVGELMISGSMITGTQNFKEQQFNEFKKLAVSHQKLICELQDISMSLRMVPLSATFNKMSRIIRDISKKMEKDIKLDIIGEDTEIDKNIVESIADPLMHLVRNAADHGIEEKDSRLKSEKSQVATITLEAKNVGGEVWIIVKDDGKGLDKEKIYNKAKTNNLISKDISDMTDDEVYSLIFMPGFSTKETVTEFSGRGVGLDVVIKNITNIGGSVNVTSTAGKGSTFTIRIPLTLAIIGGMIIKVGDAKYALPTMRVNECFRPQKKDLVTDPNGNEMILVRGECYPILSLHRIFKVNTEVKEFTKGVLIMVENEDYKYCIFADELIEEQQIVVKPLPDYISKKIKGISGCTLLGDGSISLIVDLESLAA